jgi:hypothetical protein
VGLGSAGSGDGDPHLAGAHLRRLTVVQVGRFSLTQATATWIEGQRGPLVVDRLTVVSSSPPRPGSSPEARQGLEERDEALP